MFFSGHLTLYRWQPEICVSRCCTGVLTLIAQSSNSERWAIASYGGCNCSTTQTGSFASFLDLGDGATLYLMSGLCSFWRRRSLGWLFILFRKKRLKISHKCQTNSCTSRILARIAGSGMVWFLRYICMVGIWSCPDIRES